MVFLTKIIAVLSDYFCWQAIVDDFGTLDWADIYRQLQHLPTIARRFELVA
jgi:hypothetical protein